VGPVVFAGVYPAKQVTESKTVYAVPVVEQAETPYAIPTVIEAPAAATKRVVAPKQMEQAVSELLKYPEVHTNAVGVSAIAAVVDDAAATPEA